MEKDEETEIVDKCSLLSICFYSMLDVGRSMLGVHLYGYRLV
jgi:hypothetical protein